MTATHRHTNRLARETSPYLQQHQHNPVDWMPWGPEAFERARREDKPIFLSVGYSTCYWCHVMERQCFEVEPIAEVMNRHFVNIKVDREERPDVDQLYMTAVQVMTRQGGWPMSVWLTPDLKPFYGGTYFPPVDSYGRPGFPSLCDALADAWRDRREQVHASADELTGIVARIATESGERDAASLDPATIDRLIIRSTDDYEREFGGFGNAPKFPRETLLSLLLAWLDSRPAASPDRDRVARQLRHTLDAMANGGIRDHLGGGFHRYSTDARWLVPHFEIMLYDQAMLAPVYARAARILDEPRYATVARGICDFVLREMTSPAGTFFTAFDAEVDGREGLNYLWTPGEIESVLGRADAAVFNRVYGVDRGPNFADPHHGNGEPDANILFLPDGAAQESDPSIIEMRERLLAARGRRKQPSLDTKVITQWNGLMIAGLAIAGRELNEDRYRMAAMRAADALLALHQRADRTLARTSRDADVRHEATLDDYASLAVALVELHAATRDPRWRQRADAIVRTAERLYGDAAGGGYFFTSSSAQDLIVRQKSASDSPLPSGNAQLGAALLALDRADAARAVVDAFGGRLASYAESMSSLLEVALQLTKSRPPATPTAAKAPPLDELVGGAPVHLLARRISDRRIEVTVDIRPGYHINDAVIANASLHATRLTVGGAAGEWVDAIDYPPAGLFQPGFGPAIAAYAGSLTIVVRFKTPLPADTPIPLALSYQACDDTTCLAPAAVRIEI